jgi:hypothetical protein
MHGLFRRNPPNPICEILPISVQGGLLCQLAARQDWLTHGKGQSGISNIANQAIEGRIQAGGRPLGNAQSFGHLFLFPTIKIGLIRNCAF